MKRGGVYRVFGEFLFRSSLWPPPVPRSCPSESHRVGNDTELIETSPYVVRLLLIDNRNGGGFTLIPERILLEASLNTEIPFQDTRKRITTIECLALTHLDHNLQAFRLRATAMSSGPEQERPPQQQPQAVPQQPPPPQQQPIPNQPMLPAAFVEDPAGFLASIASQQPSRAATSHLAGPVAAFLGQQEPFVGTTPPPTETPSSSQIAALYLQAAAKQLAGDVKVGDMEQEMIRAQQHYEILEVSLLLKIEIFQLQGNPSTFSNTSAHGLF